MALIKKHKIMKIREVENPKFKDLIGWSSPMPSDMANAELCNLLDSIKIVGSGKGAIAIILRYLTEKKIILDKFDEVLVSDGIGFWVYNHFQPFCFPVKKYSEKTKAMFVYHQYGFPQDMDKIMEFALDKKLIVIEDCAHALASEYRGKPLGSFGDFSIYSFSKWFFCFALGGVKSKFEDFNDYTDKSLINVPFGLTFIKDSAKFLYEYSEFSSSKKLKRFAKYFLYATYALYGEALKPSRLARNLLFSKIDKEVQLRRKRYSYFLERTNHLGICDHLEKDGITPYVIPIYSRDLNNENIIKKLHERGVITGLYRFDINRNMLSPKFVPCVWVPCHSRISDNIFSDITEIIIKNC